MSRQPSICRAGNGILRRFSHLLTAHVVREILQTIFLVYLARKSTTTYGQFMLAMSLGQILLFISEFGLNQHLVSLLVRKEAEGAGDTLIQVTVLKAVLLAFGLLGMVGFLFWQNYPPMLKAVALVLGIGVGFEALASSMFVSCQVLGRQDIEGKIRAISAALGFGYGIIALVFGFTPLALAFYKSIETLCNLVGTAFLNHKTARLPFRFPRIREVVNMGKTSWSYTAMAVATILYNKANIFFLQRFAGADGVAQYSATWQIVDGISCLVANLLLRNVLFPHFSGLWEKDRTDFSRTAQTSASWLLAISLPIMFILVFESDRIIQCIYGAGYLSAIRLQKLLSTTVLIGFLHNLAAYLMMSMRKERLLLIIYVIGLIFNLVCCGVLIPAAPLMGTALAIVLTKAFVAAMTVSYCHYQINLIPSRPLLQLSLTVAAGGVLYLLTQGVLPREAAEAAAIAPIVAIALLWRHTLTTGGAIT